MTRPIDPVALLSEVASVTHGATALFVGTVRDVNDGREVTGMEYAAYERMAERELATILEEARARYHVESLVVEHRIGPLTLGEISVAIVAAHAHRAPAFEAARYAIEEIKRRVPIWKREHYTDGTRAWVSPASPAPAPVAP